jgi:serine/alanine adding enzyme
MITIKSLGIEDETVWQSLLPIHKTVFGSVEYASIWQAHNGTPARLFALQTPNHTIAYPLSLRPIHTLPLAENQSELLWDALTPEYTGPFAASAPSPADHQLFAHHFSGYCREQGIVTEFAHLHPWQAQMECLTAGNLQLDRRIVYVDLRLNEDQLWQDSLNYTCRKNIKRSLREGVRVFAATNAGDIAEFYRIYVHTMERNMAASRYYFSLDFFMAFFDRMPHNSRFVLAEHQGAVVAGTLYLYDDNDIYSYLGGADATYQQMRPSNAVVYETMGWGRAQGKSRLILGGGYQPDDGIFRFKASFSPLTAAFHIYKCVHLPEQYERLSRAWCERYPMQAPPDNYFPPYRAVPG